MEVRISKYDPRLRNSSGSFRGDEWTSVSDIGLVYGLTLESYKYIEEQYWNTLKSILDDLAVSSLRLTGFETDIFVFSGAENKYEIESLDFCKRTLLEDGMLVCLSQFKPFFEAAMREIVWFRAVAANGTFVHFGRDYYLYCGSDLGFNWQAPIGIYVEELKSPYHGS